MFVPCEFAIRLVIPTVRAFITKELHNTYQLHQREIATLLHVTQSAVSQYLRNKRGYAIPVEYTRARIGFILRILPRIS
jgi:predicted transcriptional regulator